MQALDPRNGWSTELALLSAIEYALQVVNHSIIFQHAGKNNKKMRETFPTKLLEPDFITEAREASRNERVKMSTDELDAIMSARRVRVAEQQPQIEI